MDLELLIPICLLSAVVGAIIGSQRGEAATGLFFGFFLGPIGVIITYFTTGLKCPYCKKLIDPKALKCPFCQSELSEEKILENKKIINSIDNAIRKTVLESLVSKNTERKN